MCRKAKKISLNAKELEGVTKKPDLPGVLEEMGWKEVTYNTE